MREGARSDGPRVRIFDAEEGLYEQIKIRVDAQNERLRYYYDAREKIIVIETLASHAHESLQFYLTQDFRSSLQEWVRKIIPKAIVDIAGTVRHDLYDTQGIRLKGKTPDQGFRILMPPRYKKQGSYPNIVIEIGYSESYSDLCDDARRWLCETDDGSVLCVIIFSFKKPTKDEDFLVADKWRAFLEVYERYVHSY